MAEIGNKIETLPKTTVKEEEPNGCCILFCCNMGNFLKRKDNNPEIIKTNKDQEDRHENNKNITDKKVKNYANIDESGKGDKRETSNGIKSQDVLQARTFNSQKENENMRGALERIPIAEAAFQEGQYDKAEKYLLESQNSQKAKSLLETVHSAKVQNNTNVVEDIEKNYNDHFNKHSQNEEMNEYNKCIKLASKYMAEGNSTKAEHFLKKAVRINPNEAAKEQLKLIQDSIASQTSNNVAVTSKVVKSEKDLKREKKAEILANLDFKDKNGKNLTNVTVKTEKIYNEHVTDQSLNERNSEYTKCIDLTEQAIAEGDLAKAERFLSKAIRIWPNDKARKHLKRIQNVRASQLNNNETNDLDSVPKSERLVKAITAEEYIDDTQHAFDEDSFKKALRLPTKSERIYPTAKVNDLRKQVKEKLFENAEDSDETVTRNRKNIHNKNAGVPQPLPRRGIMTSEQISEIERVKQANDDYEILGIPRESTFEEGKNRISS